MAYGKSRIALPRVLRIELDPSPAAADLIAHTSRQLRRVANYCVREWIEYHDRRQTLARIGAGWPAVACPPDLCARWLRGATSLVPDVQTNTVLAVTNWLAQTYTSQKSPLTRQKRWLAVLRGDESHWDYRWPLPVRLWTGNARMVRSASGRPELVVRLDRVNVPGRKRAESTPVSIALRKPTAGKRSASLREAIAAAGEIADGRRRLAQSQIIQQRGKWFIMLTVEGEVDLSRARDRDRIVVVRPGRHSALRIHADTISGGYGDEMVDRVAQKRYALDRRRAGILAEHGRVPKNISEQLSLTWRNEAGHICTRLVQELVGVLRERSYGRVLWLDGNNRTAALAMAGRNAEGDRRELFPFERLRFRAANALAKIGIEVVERGNFRAPKRRIAERRKRRAASDGLTSAEQRPKNRDRSQKASRRVAAPRVAESG